MDAVNDLPLAVVGALRRDEPYADLFAEQRTPIFRLAVLLCGSTALAEEVAAEVFARVLPMWRRGRIEDPAAYLRRATVNEVRSRFRRRANERRAMDRQRALSAEGVVGDPVLHDPALHAALQSLAPRQRAVVVLRYFDDLSEADVARIIDAPIGTVKALNSRGLAALRTSLGGGSRPSGPTTTPITNRMTNHTETNK